MVFSITCWWLWRWRNARSFDSNPNIPIDQLSFIFARVGTVKKAFERSLGVVDKPATRRREVFIRRKHPGEGWVKLNTDGAAKGNPGAAGA